MLCGLFWWCLGVLYVVLVFRCVLWGVVVVFSCAMCCVVVVPVLCCGGV